MWMGNDPRKGPQQPRDARCDDGWGRSLGHGTQRTTDTWTPRTGDSYRPNNQKQCSGNREKSRDRNPAPAPQSTQCRNDRSQSRGRPSQQQSQKGKDPRQHSLIHWVTPGDKSRERSGVDGTSSGKSQPDNEYRTSQTSCR